MEEAWLRSQLESGRSIEAIAREVGKAPSTVGYWANKHDLVSTHAARHASRGGIERKVLETLVAQGASIRSIAGELGVSYATVRHWLRRYDLTTSRARLRAETAAARTASEPSVSATCERHGLTRFGRRADGGYRCLRCRAESVVARRRKIKSTLVRDAGGACVLCGYDRSPVALQFHHTHPGSKSFGIADRGVARALATARAEARKCVLLCANCHAEIEAGLATLPISGPTTRGPV
jgi:transposase-like protein